MRWLEQLVSQSSITTLKPGFRVRRLVESQTQAGSRCSIFQRLTLGLEEWELLLNVNVIAEPMGQAFADILALVREKGYMRDGESVPPASVFGLGDLIDAAGADEMVPVYHAETLRALRQRLGALEGTGLFSAQGHLNQRAVGRGAAYGGNAWSSVSELQVGGRRGSDPLADRGEEHGSVCREALALDPQLTETERARVSAVAGASVARTVVILDEAQAFLAPGPNSPARSLFVRLVKEGRNMGLSAVLATQQPSALDQRVLSQVETFITHQLVTEPDIRAVRENLKSNIPEQIQFGPQSLDFSGLLRQLPPGICVVSAADMNTSIRRASVVQVRPRATVHGGIEL